MYSVMFTSVINIVFDRLRNLLFRYLIAVFSSAIYRKLSITYTRGKLRVSQGFWGTREHWQNIQGNKGTLANFWEQGNKIRKITVRKHSERVWEHGNIRQFWKGTRTPPWETLQTQSSNAVDCSKVSE